MKQPRVKEQPRVKKVINTQVKPVQVKRKQVERKQVEQADFLQFRLLEFHVENTWRIKTVQDVKKEIDNDFRLAREAKEAREARQRAKENGDYDDDNEDDGYKAVNGNKRIKKTKTTMPVPRALLEQREKEQREKEQREKEEREKEATINEKKKGSEDIVFTVLMMGMMENGKTVAMYVQDFTPFFFIKIPPDMNLENFRGELVQNGCDLLKLERESWKKLYGFDGGKQHDFVRLSFSNMAAFNKTKNLWFTKKDKDKDKETDKQKDKQKEKEKEKEFDEYILNPLGYLGTQIYEGNILPLLRVFHCRQLSPSGWVQVQRKNLQPYAVKEEEVASDGENENEEEAEDDEGKKERMQKCCKSRVRCDLEYLCRYNDIEALPEKETRVPFVVASFDIEASSSHGDFPVPVKTYQKFATEFVDWLIEAKKDKERWNGKTRMEIREEMTDLFFAAFFPESERGQLKRHIVSRVYPKLLDDNDGMGTKSPVSPEGLQCGVNNFFNIAFDVAKTAIDEDTVKNQSLNDSLKTDNEEQQQQGKNNQENDDDEEKDDDKENENDNDNDTEEEEQEQEDNDGDVDKQDKENQEDVVEMGTFCESSLFKVAMMKQKAEVKKILSSSSFSSLASKKKTLRVSPKRQTLFRKKGETSNDNNDDKATNEKTMLDFLLLPDLPREYLIGRVNNCLTPNMCNFFELEGDRITFIGTTFFRLGETEPFFQHCLVIGDCEQIGDHAEIQCVENERGILLEWVKLLHRINPDVVMGYNINSFDYEFMYQRALQLGCCSEFVKDLSRVRDYRFPVDRITKQPIYDLIRSQTVLASGTFLSSMPVMVGRLQIDMLSWIRRTMNLQSYKLDSVAGLIIGDAVKKVEINEAEDKTRVFTKNMSGLYADSFVHFQIISYSANAYKNNAKFRVLQVNKAEDWFEIQGKENIMLVEGGGGYTEIRWGLAKDDVSPQDIFRLTNGSAKDRAIVAKYCIQDCNLVQHLFIKNDVMTELVEMSRLCSVPLNFLVSRGQSIKLTSYVAKKCLEKGVLMPCLAKGDPNSAYEGAIVLIPKCNIYEKDPVPVGDFASLYPSSMLSENLCPSSKVWIKTYRYEVDAETGKTRMVFVNQTDGLVDIRDDEAAANATQFEYDNLPGWDYVDRGFDLYEYRVNVKSRVKKMEKVKIGWRVCRFAQPKHDFVANGVDYTRDEVAIMPAILKELLQARKDTRKNMKTITDAYMKNILDKRQLKIKETANSVYGQLGFKTSSFFDMDVAAATTATGRMSLVFAQTIIEACYKNKIVTSKIDNKQFLANAEYIYGDTDSVFFTLHLRSVDPESGEIMEQQVAESEGLVQYTIEFGKEVCSQVSKVLKCPHEFEYEKTYFPFCLLRKKGYVGMKYGEDHLKCKRDEMGIVLKRRDNAPLVKDVYGGSIDIIMKKRSVEQAVQFVKEKVMELVDKTKPFPIDKLVISKSLRSFYKDPQKITQWVLAQRIEKREPGKGPKPGDRVPFVFILPSEEVIQKAKDELSKAGKKIPKSWKKLPILQGNRVEAPYFIQEHSDTVKIDYAHYITNQLAKPLQQLFALCLHRLLTDSQKSELETKLANESKNNMYKDNPTRWENRKAKLVLERTNQLLFKTALDLIDKELNKQTDIASFGKQQQDNAKDKAKDKANGDEGQGKKRKIGTTKKEELNKGLKTKQATLNLVARVDIQANSRKIGEDGCSVYVGID